MKKVDRAGKRFGKVLVVSYSHTEKGKVYWNIVCDCGNKKVMRGDSLQQGSGSCGCVHNTKGNPIHGLAGSYVYSCWNNMKRRCLNKYNDAYKYYGGRGISVCSKWMEFEGFLEDMGLPQSSKHSIDRIDNNGDYKLENCRWASSKEQARNTSKTLYVEYKGVRMPLVEAAEKSGVAAYTLRYRYHKGWSNERMFTKTRRHYQHYTV